MKTLLAAAAMLLPPAAALLAGAPTSAAAQAVVMPAAPPNVLRAGTPVALRLIEGLTTREKNARINDRVRLEVAEAVAVNGAVIIPVGSPAIGELTDVRNKGMWGKSGRIVGRVLSVNANGRTIRLSGTFDSKGGSGTAGAVAVSAVVFAPAGFFMTGKSADMPAGTMLRGFIEEDVPFALTHAAPIAAPVAAPMLVSR